MWKAQKCYVEIKQNFNCTIDSALSNHLDLIGYYVSRRTEKQIRRISGRLALGQLKITKNLNWNVVPVSNLISFHLRMTSGGSE